MRWPPGGVDEDLSGVDLRLFFNRRVLVSGGGGTPQLAVRQKGPLLHWSLPDPSPLSPSQGLAWTCSLSPFLRRTGTKAEQNLPEGTRDATAARQDPGSGPQLGRDPFPISGSSEPSSSVRGYVSSFVLLQSNLSSVGLRVLQPATSTVWGCVGGICPLAQPQGSSVSGRVAVVPRLVLGWCSHLQDGHRRVLHDEGVDPILECFLQGQRHLEHRLRPSWVRCPCSTKTQPFLCSSCTALKPGSAGLPVSFTGQCK